MPGQVFLIPAVLSEEEIALQTIPTYILQAVKQCEIFFVENEKTARRFLKKLWKEMVIDDYKWYAIHKAEEEVRTHFVNHLKENKNIGIISEAGCPGVADPGQILVNAAQEISAVIHPLVGPSAILLSLMASGMNGQFFQFLGYLPIDAMERKKVLRDLEADSFKRNCTQIFIETPYRNNQLIKDVLSTCKNETKFCIAADITSSTEIILTRSVGDWKKQTTPDIHKRPAMFLIYAQ